MIFSLPLLESALKVFGLLRGMNKGFYHFHLSSLVTQYQNLMALCNYSCPLGYKRWFVFNKNMRMNIAVRVDGLGITGFARNVENYFRVINYAPQTMALENEKFLGTIPKTFFTSRIYITDNK